MKSLQNPLLFLLALTTAFAAPIHPPPRHDSRILPRQRDQDITQPVTFETVEVSQTSVGTITETCKVTLTPITNDTGAQSIRQDKSCTYVVLQAGDSPPPPAFTSGDNGQATTTTSADAGATTTSSDTSTSTSSSAPVTDTAASSSSSDTPTTPAAEPTTTPAASEPAPSVTPAVTSVQPIISTLSDGAVTTVTDPSAAQAQTSATQEEVPGRKLEVLPIGLGVFAGISVIALIVVGLVTYERTKYRRAFRQRKLAEAGANMGYGGMAERT